MRGHRNWGAASMPSGIQGGRAKRVEGGGTKGGRASMLARVAGTRSQVTSLVMASDALPFS